MAKKATHAAKAATVKNREEEVSSSLFDRIDAFILKRFNKFKWGLTILAAILAFASFQGKISIGNDDALYLVSGYKMGMDPINNPYTESAPLYVMFLALMTKIIGLKILPLKLFSVIFFVASVPVFFEALKNKIKPSALVFGILLLVTNWMMLEYASYTYTEAFYLLLYALLFWAYSKQLDIEEEIEYDRQKHIKSAIILAFLSIIIIMARNVGAVIPILIVFLFLLRKNWKDTLYYVGSFAGFFALRTAIFNALWPNLNQYSTQGSKIFQKDNYDPSKGTEDFNGMVERFLLNCKSYTVRFFETLGFTEPYKSIKFDEHGFEATLFFGILIAAFIIAIIRKQKMMQMVLGFALILLAATFISLQVAWSQHRLITIYVPLIGMGLWYFFQEVTSKKSINFLQVFVLILAFIFVGSSTISSVKRAATNIPIAIDNLKGDKYKGYTQDWINFLKASEWCAQNLPDDVVIASRKEPMSYIYSGGREFYPIYRVPKDTLTGGNFTDADQYVEWFRNAPYRKNLNTIEKVKVEYFILAQLRLDIKRKIPGQFINTIHNCLAPIEQKYPGCFELIHTEGSDEITQVVKLNYDYIDRMRLATSQQELLNNN